MAKFRPHHFLVAVSTPAPLILPYDSSLALSYTHGLGDDTYYLLWAADVDVTVVEVVLHTCVAEETRDAAHWKVGRERCA